MQNPKAEALQKAFPNEEDMKTLAKKCSKLSSFKANVLRTTSMGTVDWEKKGDAWKGGVQQGSGASK